MLNESFEGGVLYFKKMVTSAHDLVVLLVAAPVHLFGLAEGSIPSTTTGIGRFQEDRTHFLRLENCSLAGCNILWVAPRVFSPKEIVVNFSRSPKIDLLFGILKV